MFNLGGSEVIVILLIALIVLGPEKLPETARKIGNVMGELRRMSTGFQSEIRSAMDDAVKTPSTENTPSTSSSEPTRLEPVPDDTAPDGNTDHPAA